MRQLTVANRHYGAPSADIYYSSPRLHGPGIGRRHARKGGARPSLVPAHVPQHGSHHRVARRIARTENPFGNRVRRALKTRRFLTVANVDRKQLLSVRIALTKRHRELGMPHMRKAAVYLR